MTLQSINTGRKRETSQILVSSFRNRIDPQPIGDVALAEFLFSSTYKKQVEVIRGCPDPVQRRALKSRLPAITPSGIFSQRCNDGLVQHSGIICIDIDEKDNPTIDDWKVLKWSLADMPGLWYAGLSVSARGLFLLFRIKYPKKHLEHFNSLSAELNHRGIVVDANCKDVARLRWASYDDNPYFNPEISPFVGLLQEERSATPSTVSTPDISDKTAIRVSKLVCIIARNGANIAEGYLEWFAIGRALASEFGESGRSWYHTVSAQSLKYKPKECDRQYDQCLKICSRTSIRTFFYYCKQNGITTL